MVTSLPARFISGTPMGISYSSSGTPPGWNCSATSYMRWLSRNITGSVPFRADCMRPLASYGVAGNTTLRPEIWAHIALQSWLCCAPYFEPTLMRSTTGILSIPALMACHLESWLKTSSPARPRKSQYMSSATALPPLMP